jgi:hypothetical protein
MMSEMIDRCLSLHPTHVTKKDVILLWWSTDEEREQYATLPMMLSAYENGLFCWVVTSSFCFTDQEMRDAGLSESFIKVMSFARTQDCTLLHISDLGEVLDENPLLDNHHWEMGDNNLWDLSTDDIQDINEVMNKL